MAVLRNKRGCFVKGTDAWNSGLNISGMSGKKQSEKQKNLLKFRNKYNNPSKRPEVKEKMRLAKLGKVGNRKGTHVSEETKQKCRETWKNKNFIFTQEHRIKISLGCGGTGIPYENNKYPREFFEIRSKIRKRDNYTCQNCGMIEIEHIQKFKKILEIHHIDYNKNNNIEHNLITTCHTCNTKANLNKSYWITYYKNILRRI